MTATESVRHHADDTADGLLRAVVEYPFDLRPRLVLADRLDEIGEGERAEFIRLDCDPGGIRHEDAHRLWHRHNAERWAGDLYAVGIITVSPAVWATAYQENARLAFLRNGFVEEVRCPLGWWLGEECGRCDSQLRAANLVRHCRCKGTGTTPGHGAEVVARHPVTRVVVTDRKPFRGLGGTVSPWWLWVRLSNPTTRTDGHAIPDEIWERLPDDGLLPPWSVRDRAKRYRSREAAETALSRALVDIARERAGLPPITWEVTE
jgi:uncharacterized protein (TIGR02996 family)